MVAEDKLPTEPSKTPLFIRFNWDGKLPDVAAILAHPPGEVAACGLELPPSLSGPLAEQALKDFSAAVKEKLPTARTAAILTKPFQIERSPAVDFIMPAESSPPAKAHPGWEVFRYLSFATWRKNTITPGDLTAAEIIRGAAWGTIPADENIIRRLTSIHGLISIHGGYSSAEDDAPGMVLFLLPGGLSSGPEWWLSQLDGWFEAALDAGLHLRVLQAGEVTPRDIERYRVVLVPVPEGLNKETADAIAHVPAGGGVAVFGGVPRGEGSEVLLALMGIETSSPIVRYEQETPLQGGIGKYEEVPIALPELGTDGIARLWTGIKAGQAKIFLGRSGPPVITVKNLASGWVSLMNIDMLDYARISRAGLTGSSEIRALLKFWAGRGRAGVLLGEHDGWRVWGTAGGDWYHLAFLEIPELKDAADAKQIIESTLQASAGTEAMVSAAAVGHDGIAVAGWFRRRIESLRTDTSRNDGVALVTAIIGGLDPDSRLPAIAELAHGSSQSWHPGLFRCIMLGGTESSIDLPESMQKGQLRILVRDPFFGFRALAEVF
jgi:hypothetical protein